MPSQFPKIQPTTSKAEVTIEVTRATGYAYSIVNNPEGEQFAQRLENAIRRPLWLRIIGRPYFMMTDTQLEIAQARQASSSISDKTKAIVSDVRAANSTCEIQEPSTRIRDGVAGSVTFRCEAANCCMSGLAEARRALDQDMLTTCLEAQRYLPMQAALPPQI